MTRRSQTSHEDSRTQSLIWAKAHVYEEGIYAPDFVDGVMRKRLEPGERFSLIMNAFIDASIGKIKTKSEASIWHVKHTDLYDLHMERDIRISVASIFNYFCDRETLLDCIVVWAVENLTSKDSLTAEVALKILNQYAAIRPVQAAELGVISMPIKIKESLTDSARGWCESNSLSLSNLIKNKARKILREF